MNTRAANFYPGVSAPEGKPLRGVRPSRPRDPAQVVAATQTRRDPAEVNLDVLRGLAALCVFLFHASVHFRVEMPFVSKDGGWFGVQLFFLLSGYLIVHSAERYPFWTYWRHRVLRLWPAYLAVFFMGGALRGNITIGQIIAHPADFLVSVCLLGHVWPSARMNFPAVVVSWTLTVELFWYVLAPILAGSLRRRPWAWAVFGCILTTVWVRLSVSGTLDHPAQQLASGSVDRFLFINNAFPAQLSFFLIGALLRFRRAALSRLNPLLLVGLFATFGMFPHAQPWWPWLDTPTFLSGIGLGALFTLALVSPPLPWAWPWRFLAKISYSFYLTHHLAIDFVHDHYGLTGWPGVGASLVVSIPVSILLFYAVERPAMRLARGRTST